MPLTKVSAGVIAANAVVDSFGTQSITGDKIGLGAITGNTLASNIINANNIVNASITGAKLAANTVSGDVIGQNAINANNVVSGIFAAIDTAQTFTKGQRGEITALTDGATITPDFADSNNFSVTLGGNRTLANPSNVVAGQSGSFFITQDGTGSRTLAYGSNYDFAGGTAPTLSTAASAVDRIDYVVRTATSIHCVFTANYS